MSEKTLATHLERRASVYLRQSTLKQVYEHRESTTRQYALKQRAVELAQGGLRHHAGVSGAALFGLHRPLEVVAAGELRLHTLALMADHHHLAAHSEQVERLEHMRQQRPACHRVQHLGEIAVHALPHASRENQCGDVRVTVAAHPFPHSMLSINRAGPTRAATAMSTRCSTRATGSSVAASTTAM